MASLQNSVSSSLLGMKKKTSKRHCGRSSARKVSSCTSLSSTTIRLTKQARSYGDWPRKTPE